MSFDFWSSQVAPSPGPMITVVALPPKQFFRVAVLTDNPSQSSLKQGDGNWCYPHDPFAISSFEWQDDYDPETDIVTTTFGELQTIRGIHGWFMTSCVLNGDGSEPGRPDDRNAKMGVISPIPAPFAVQIRF